MAKVRGGDTVRRNLRAYDERYKATVRFVLAREAEVVTARLKAEAPWQDVTGAARRGLHTDILDGQPVFTLRAAHSVPYGVFLETKFQGRYAVLQPVVRTQWPKTLRRIAAEVKKVRAT